VGRALLGPTHRLPPAEVTEIDREDAPGTESSGGRHECAFDGRFIREIAQDVANRDDRVTVGERIIRQDQPANRLRTGGDVPRQLEHRRGCICGDDAVACLDEVTREQAAPATQLENKPLSVTNGL
jgi:hypothetical protein